MESPPLAALRDDWMLDLASLCAHTSMGSASLVQPFFAQVMKRVEAGGRRASRAVTWRLVWRPVTAPSHSLTAPFTANRARDAMAGGDS